MKEEIYNTALELIYNIVLELEQKDDIFDKSLNTPLNISKKNLPDRTAKEDLPDQIVTEDLPDQIAKFIDFLNNF